MIKTSMPAVGNLDWKKGRLQKLNLPKMNIIRNNGNCLSNIIMQTPKFKERRNNPAFWSKWKNICFRGTTQTKIFRWEGKRTCSRGTTWILKSEKRKCTRQQSTHPTRATRKRKIWTPDILMTQSLDYVAFKALVTIHWPNWPQILPLTFITRYKKQSELEENTDTLIDRHKIHTPPGMSPAPHWSCDGSTHSVIPWDH